ncbi:MAG: hypothetical protein WAT19_12960 [Ferruginibacter sp.]
MKKIFFYPIALIAFFSCTEKEEEANAAEYQCKTMPAFVKNTGLNPARVAFSTSEMRSMGLNLKEMPLDMAVPAKTYQHPSWKAAGWLSTIQLDKMGNLFTAPAPFVNVLNNPVKDQNTIYKVNSADGMLAEFLKLPWPKEPDSRNPFGIAGLAYNCKNNILYASTVAGSTPAQQVGCIYAIDAGTKQIVDEIKGQDFFGIQVVVAAGRVFLLAGSARSSEFYAIPLKANGKFSGKPRLAGSIEGLGARGNDKVKKIIFKAENNIQIKGIEFDFNLIAPTEKQESNYDFYYDYESGKWMLRS